MTTIHVVDYGAGNLASVLKALRAVGLGAERVTAPSAITSSGAILVPGVGNFAATRSLGDPWKLAIRDRLRAGASLLGICLGMQWLYDGSEEAPDIPGLGVVAGRCVRLQSEGALKVPHVGWNALERTSTSSRLLAAVAPDAYAYFTHTYAAPVTPETTAVTTHGTSFASVVEHGRVFGAQWHPEKSGDVGLQVLRAFGQIASEHG